MTLRTKLARFAIYLLVAGVIPLAAQTLPFMETTDLQLQVTGKVKEITENRYRVVDNVREDQPWLFHVYSYGPSGSIAAIKTHNDDGEFNTVFTLDAQGLQIQSVDVNSAGARDPKLVFTNDSKGRRLSAQSVYSDGTVADFTSYQYDAAGRLIQIAKSDSKNKAPYSVILYRYDDKNKRMQEVDGKKSTDTAPVVMERIYDAKGKPLTDSDFWSGTLSQKTIYTYNALGQLTLAVTTNTNDGESRTVSFSYDKTGNLTGAFLTIRYYAGTDRETVSKSEIVLTYQYY